MFNFLYVFTSSKWWYLLCFIRLPLPWMENNQRQPDNADRHFTYTPEQHELHNHSHIHKQSHFQGHTERCCCVYLLSADSTAPGTTMWNQGIALIGCGVNSIYSIKTYVIWWRVGVCLMEYTVQRAKGRDLTKIESSGLQKMVSCRTGDLCAAKTC